MIDPDTLIQIQLNESKVCAAKSILEEFDKLPMPSLPNYMRLVERLKLVINYDGANNE